ncbi:MAG: Gfo/Idh/MocA family oxidoreductase [Spirochaetaceae bacterium]|jgi:predicted dehydrogenase|nr:Gfo/Idh/MocA family oxidoreductase [Spirochaetaceae bacterium]
MIRVALIGTGSIFRFHVEAYCAFPQRCTIVALADIIPEKCRETKKQYHLTEAEVFDSHIAMLEALKGKIDLVDICTPPFCHARIAIDCLNAGCNVVVEKPMAASLAECDAMLDAQKQNGTMLACIAQNRFRDEVMALKKIVDSGLIGRVLHAQVDSLWWRGLSYYDLWWRGTWKSEGGGCTLNHAVHHIDLLIWMLGMPEKVTAVLANAAHHNAEVEDISIAILQYPQGALAHITSSVIHHGEEQQLIFQGEKARVSVPWKVCANRAAPNGFPQEAHDSDLEQKLTDCKQSLPPLQYTAHKGELDNILKALEQQKPPFITGIDGRNTLELITAIYKSGATGTTVKLPLTKDDPFYTVEGIMAGVPHFYEKSASVADFTGAITTGRQL